MRVPDFSSLAGCAVEDVGGNNMNNIEVNTNRISGVSEHATSSAKFVQQALKTSTPYYQEQEAHSYELMSLSANNNTYKSFKEFYINHNNNNNSNNNNNNNNNNDNTFILQQQYVTNHHDFNTSTENENLATGVEKQDASIADNDVHCLSATSSLSSISCTSKGYYIPRGIVNPNYPGFQHLAHTLSEHFICSVPTTDESDFSDNDMDLSTDSCDDLYEQQNQNVKEDDNKLQKMGVSFETALALPVRQSIDNGKNHHKSLEHLETAPDILHSNSLQNSSSKLDYQPDLLFGTKETEVTENKLETGVANTPMVDIIGDFEQEVEREFGLLVNGYKNLSVEHKSTEKVDDVVTDKTDNQILDKDVELKPRYQRHSYDERQLPPIGVDYSRCQQKQIKSKTNKITTNRKKAQLKPENNATQTQSEVKQYKSVSSGNDKDKEKDSILSNSRYAKISSWAQYLQENSNTNSEILTPNALELFDAYKISSEIDNETLKKHLKLAKEIEKKRRNNREEIRRRLAGSDDEEINAPFSRRQEYENSFNTGYVSSDTESHSSDSETCPKLSRKKHCKRAQSTNSPTPSKMSACAGPIGAKTAHVEYTAEDKECDFFTKQAVFQIETRMALAQSKEIANLQMKMQKKRQLVSPISEIVHQSMGKVGFQMMTNKRRITRQILTNMSISHLQILVNSFHTHIEDFNEELMDLLMKRDDLHLQQDDLLSHIENMTRYLGVNFSQQKTYPV